MQKLIVNCLESVQITLANLEWQILSQIELSQVEAYEGRELAIQIFEHPKRLLLQYFINGARSLAVNFLSHLSKSRIILDLVLRREHQRHQEP